MSGDRESTPLLQGRRAGEGITHTTTTSSGGDGGGIRSQSTTREQWALLARARAHPLLFVAAAVGAAALVVSVGLVSTSVAWGTSTRLGSAEASLAATNAIPDTAAVEHAGWADQERGNGGAVGESGDRKAADGGWRSQADRSPATAGRPAVTLGNGDDKGPPSLSTNNVGTPGSTRGATKPNVFFFLIDDMGHGDIGYQSTDLYGLTPNLDKLAAGGVKLTNYYSMTLCTPARASIMTGRYPIRYGLQYSVILPGAPWGLPLSEKILPQYLREAGYEPHMVGKWHLGSHNAAALPSNRGFETYLGYLHGKDTYFSHKNTEAVLDGEYFFDFGYGNATGYYDVSRHDPDGVSCPNRLEGPQGEDDVGSRDPADTCYTGTYSTDAFVGRAREIIESKSPFDEKPLFLYLAHQAVHSPTGPPPWDNFTSEELDLLDAVKLETGSDLRKQFAGVLLYLDKRIGALVDLLDREGWLKNSVIVVASDNGGCPQDGGTNYPLRGVKQSVYEGGSKVPAIVWSKSHLPEDVWGTSYDKLMHSTDWLPTIATAAGVEISGSAGPLDGVDHWQSLTRSGSDSGGGWAADDSDDPRTEMLYNWDPYLLSSSDGLRENWDLVQGAYRAGDWKLLVNVWCSGYYSFDPAVVESDALLNPEVACSGTAQCEDCEDRCQLDEKYAYGNRLYNLKDDPREEHDLYDIYPEIARRLRKRADEVVQREWGSSRLLPIDERSYDVWKDNHWWMLPWEEELHKSKAGLSLNGLM